MHSDIIKEYEKHSNHSPIIMLLCVGVKTPIPLRLDLGQEAWPITRRVQGLIRQPGVSRKETRCGDQAGF